MIKKILVANRGEIAVRIIRTAKKMDILTVAVYSETDRDSLHITLADESFCIGEAELSETYLNIPRIIEAATNTHCDAVHPGYGFLAENPAFVDACDQAGLVFIGPDKRSMHVMGNKIESREFVVKTGVPVTAGITGTKETLIKRARTLGFPVLLKAAAGGGGKGMKIVYAENELEEAIEATSRQAKSYFADETVYIEKFIEEPRHIEVQILGDHSGNVIHLFERECSIQRRYQKIIEESPSPTLSGEVRTRICEAAVKIGKEIGYSSAGTIEFLVDRDLNFYFLEMNTRIQVEHPVTEMVTGIDIVEEQILIASGKKLRIRQKEICQHGHAIECRIYAEDPMNSFLPSPGKMTLYVEPESEGIRIDTGISGKTEIMSLFDPMISKLIVWGETREVATARMKEALEGYHIHGIKTNLSYLKQLLKSREFTSNAISTRFCDLHTEQLISAIASGKENIPKYIPVIGFLLYTLNGINSGLPGNKSLWETIGYWRDLMRPVVLVDGTEHHLTLMKYDDVKGVVEFLGRNYEAGAWIRDDHKAGFEIDGRKYSLVLSEDGDGNTHLNCDGHIFTMKRLDHLVESHLQVDFEHMVTGKDYVTSPMPGKVIKINVSEGESVKKGSVLLIIEAMKMENSILSPVKGIVDKINVSVNDRVEVSNPLIHLIEES
ncbi:MAG: acetyl-CoA carboxylase biotin carboxylase subunit [bacterium]